MTRDDEFRPKLGKPRDRRAPPRFLRQLRKAAEKHVAGAGKRLGRPARRSASRGSRRLYRGGAVALRLGQQRVPPGQRRVVVKARIVRQDAGKRTLLPHLKYLKRDGVTRDGAPGRLFDAVSDDVDERSFAERAEGDRHHFRFMVSPEDGELLTDLKAFTRDLMQQMEADLGTRLEWAALAHYNTDNPHIHITVRGIDDTGKDLVIDRDYISLGLRVRAQDLATLELGLQTEREIEAKQRREIGQERFTTLDRALLRDAVENVIDLRPDAAHAPSPLRSLLMARLETLRRLALAEEIETGRWRLAPELEPTLRALGERGDIVKAMNRALTARGLDRSDTPFAVHDDAPDTPIIGRLVDKGFVDELTDRMHLIVDGIDGRTHHVPIGGIELIEALRSGNIVEVQRDAVSPRQSDRTIARLAGEEDGIYRPSRHLAEIRTGQRVPNDDYDGYVEAHVRRLEALRRAGLVQRLDADRWRVPDNLVERGAAFDAQRRGQAVAINTLSLIDLDEQITARGATWLDHQFVGRNKVELGEAGFAAEARAATERRAEHLIAEGLAERRNNRVLFARNLLATLERRDLERAAERIAKDTDLPYRALADGETVRGTYRRSIDLSSGRYALIENAREFTLVPWRPVIERELGREVSGIVRGRGVSWSFGRDRGLSR